MPLTIPNTAPFSGAQKMWLKGFLDGINSALIPPLEEGSASMSNPNHKGLPVTILWGSQTGNAEALGKKLTKYLTTKGHSPTLRSMADVSLDELTSFKYLFIITSTYGDGEPPDNASILHAALHAADAPQLSDVNFSVFALGDSNYPDFCKCGHDFQNRLSELEAKPLTSIVECDVDYEAPYASWSQQIEKSLGSLVTA